MKGNRLGKVRRSQVVMTYGPGAIIDFRAGGHGGAAVSVVAAGLEEWDRWAEPAGLLNEQRVSEARLEQKLKVRGFRLPPVGSDGRRRDGKEKSPPLLPGVRFPIWLTCPKCSLLQQARSWSEEEGDPALYCARCSTAAKRVHVVPVRFILACENGHLEEFPWHHWVSHRPECRRRKPLKLESEGAGLKGLVLSCTECGARRTMDGAFSPEAMKNLGVRCSGHRPWLPSGPEPCTAQNPPLVVQRGASNLYFPAVESSLDIPPWSDDFQAALGQQWANIVSAVTPEDQDKIVELVVWPNWEGPAMTLDEMKAKIRQRLELINAPARPELRFEEYLQLTSGQRTTDERSEFSIRPQAVPAGLRGLVGTLTQVVRLREVRAIYGFTRIHPPSGDFGTAQVAPLSVAPKTWLPAIEVRGEGIFVSLDEAAVRCWEADPDVVARTEGVRQRYEADWRSRMGADSEPPTKVTPRYMLVHTFSHALMRQLSLECGYSTSSLRERLYVDAQAPGMCGVLVYTSTADADGTLGGLVRQGRADRMEALIRSALKAIEWCSSDPLCMKGLNSLSEGLNLAACHSCVLAPETACESFNRFLDRAMLVGVPGAPEIGFFSSLMACG